MRKAKWSLTALAAALMLWGTGCVITPIASVDQYDRCAPGDFCVGTAACTPANLTVSEGAPIASFCTNGCVDSADCPLDPFGQAAVCVVTSGSAGQCYRQCDALNNCPSGFTCAAAGTTNVCVPGSASCGGAGQACCGGTSCNGSLVCTGGTCAAAPPCGNIGEACCGGTTCTAPGSACGSNGQCGLVPYAGCSGDSIGGSCLGAASSTGEVIATTCQRPMLASPGANGWCTAICNGGLSTMCPQPTDPAFQSRTFNCYMLEGSTAGQCYLDCVGGANCPNGTVCTAATSATGATIHICAPMSN
jgi:hypothetical protein